MRATANALIPQTIHSSTTGTSSRALSRDTPTTFSSGVFEEVRRLSQFVPVIVLVSKCAVKDDESPIGLALTSKLCSTQGELLRPSGKAVQLLKGASPASATAFGEVSVNFSEMTVSSKGRPVVLTALEFKVLKYLVQNARRVISRDELLNEVWGYENYPCTRTVDNHILRLRRKLEPEPSRPVHFQTVHGAGYKFLP